MEYHASDTGPEVPRDTGPVEHYSDEMGRKDLMMASSVMVVLIVAAMRGGTRMGLMIVAAIVAAIVA